MRVCARPVGGAANDALLALLSNASGRPRSTLRLVRGGKARMKMVEVEGLDETTLKARLTVL